MYWMDKRCTLRTALGGISLALCIMDTKNACLKFFCLWLQCNMVLGFAKSSLVGFQYTYLHAAFCDTHKRDLGCYIPQTKLFSLNNYIIDSHFEAHILLKFRRLSSLQKWLYFVSLGAYHTEFAGPSNVNKFFWTFDCQMGSFSVIPGR